MVCRLLLLQENGWACLLLLLLLLLVGGWGEFGQAALQAQRRLQPHHELAQPLVLF